MIKKYDEENFDDSAAYLPLHKVFELHENIMNILSSNKKIFFSKINNFMKDKIEI